jgi:signal transduction histidine kinase
MDIDRRARRVGSADTSTPASRSRLNAIAHEFNNLLTVINGYSELLLKQLDEGDVREQVLEIRQAGARVSELTEELLSIVRPPASEADALLKPDAPPLLAKPFRPGALPRRGDPRR